MEQNVLNAIMGLLSQQQIYASVVALNIRIRMVFARLAQIFMAQNALVAQKKNAYHAVQVIKLKMEIAMKLQ